MERGNLTGIYIHIPFCLRKCPYCDFFSVPYESEICKDYLRALKAQISSFGHGLADTVYFGGGTPSLLSAAQVDEILETVGAHFSLTADCEITLELNPATASPEKLRAYKSAGINRLSVGVQSTNDSVLRAIGRLHSAREALDTLAHAKRAGFDNISADLMLALPCDSEASLSKSIDDICGSEVSHVSAYLLTLMDNTPFGRCPPTGLPDDDMQADVYMSAVSRLAAHGLFQYEISNFAKPERKSRHNLKYWNCSDYLGFGAAAHSSLGKKRYSMKPNIDSFISLSSAFSSENPLRFFDLEGNVTAEDFIMMRLRTSDGLSLAELQSGFAASLTDEMLAFVRHCASSELLCFDGDVIALTQKGMLVSNSIISELI
ncbi:MAG: radical SAM family heme chaperone HemW [Oscillospiraceae bacterium]